MKLKFKNQLSSEATVAKYATVRQEGMRQVERELEYYNLRLSAPPREEISATLRLCVKISRCKTKFILRKALHEIAA